MNHRFIFFKTKELFFSFFIFLHLYFYNPCVIKAYQDIYIKRINLWPLFVYSHNKITNETEFEALGPFFLSKKTPYKKIFSFRPFFTTISSPTCKTIYFIYPFGLYKKTKSYTILKFMPIFSKTEVKNKKSLTEFLFFFTGKTDNQTFGGIFPIYGTFKNFFGKKSITFVLWPIYSKVEYDNYNATNLFWPIFRTISSQKYPSKYKGFKIWPIFGKFREMDVKKTFIFWPFYIKEENTNPFLRSEKLLIFPFYIKEENKNFKQTSILWPIYQKKEAKDGTYSQTKLFWFFYRKTDGEGIKERRFWPIFGWKKTEEKKYKFILWPLYTSDQVTIKRGNITYAKDETNILIFSKSKKVFKNNNLISKEMRIWPIFFYSRNYIIEKENLFFPYLLPMMTEGIYYNFLPFITLFWQEKEKNYTKKKLLWGFYREEQINSRNIKELAFLFRKIKDNNTNTNYIEFFEGLIGFGKIKGKPVFKFLFLKNKSKF